MSAAEFINECIKFGKYVSYRKVGHNLRFTVFAARGCGQGIEVKIGQTGGKSWRRAWAYEIRIN